MGLLETLGEALSAGHDVAYAVTSGEYSDYHVLAVFRTREAAEAACAAEIGREIQTGRYAYCGDEAAQRRRVAQIVCVEEFPLDPPAGTLP